MFPNLMAEMKRNNIKQDDIAKCIKKCHSNTNFKFNGKAEFTLKEMQEIQKNIFPGLTLDYLFERKEK